jgi:TrwC relaxase/AAA domain
MLTFRVGAAGGSPRSGAAMAAYLTNETLSPGNTERAAYYSGEVIPEPLTRVGELGVAVAEGDISYSDALNELVRAELRFRPPGEDLDVDALKDGIHAALAQAATRHEFAQEAASAGGTSGELRPDLSPAMAAKLGIADSLRPLTKEGIGNLLNGKRLDGGSIEGKKKHSATLSIAEIFGLDSKGDPIQGEAATRVLAGLRADGEPPRTASGKPLPENAVSGAVKRYKAAVGVPTHRDATAEERDLLMDGRSATGVVLDAGDYRRHINATRPPVAFIDLTFSAPKSLSVAWARAQTEVERAIFLDVHKHAVAATMAYGEELLGVARMGAGGTAGTEAGKIAWVSFPHYTARPATDIVRLDKEGRPYTERHEIPSLDPDPQIHTHTIVPNVVLTDSGRVGSIDLDRLDGAVKELGRVYQANVAQNLRRFGADVVLGKHNEAKLSAISDAEADLFSKRSRDTHRATEEFAKKEGVDWDSLSDAQQVAMLKAGGADSRNRKSDGPPDFVKWEQQAIEAGFKPRSMLRPDAIKLELEPEERRQLAFEVSRKLLGEQFERRSTLSGQELREIATTGLIVAGISERPGEDIAAVTKMFREQGVLMKDGTHTDIAWGKEAAVRGKTKWSVVTVLGVEQEQTLIDLARTASADKSAGISDVQIERAAEAFLARNPKIDRDGAQWRAQREMITRLAGPEAGRLSLGIGAAGAGKSALLEVMADAWREDGRRVYGASLAWRQTTDLQKAGIADQDRAAIDPFLRRAAKGRYALDSRSVIVIDEVALVGVKQLLDLAKLQEKTGAQIVLIGDDRQCQAVSAGPVCDVLRKALGENAIPEITTSIRQKTERELETTQLFREGRVAEALERKREDNTARIVAGGSQATINHVAQLRRSRLDANRDDPSYTLLILAPTNREVRQVSEAIRIERRQMGEIGPDIVEVDATDRQDRYTLALAAGDRVRLFDRVLIPGRDKVLANNGDVVEILKLDEQGMTVRNADGLEGPVKWSKLRDRVGDPLKLTRGEARTIDAAQGLTVSDTIVAAPHGPASITAFKAYTADSRHERQVFLVMDESAIRRALSQRQIIGQYQPIREPDIWRAAADSLSREPVKASALETLTRVTHARRGSVQEFQRGMASVERHNAREPEDRLSTYQRARIELSQVMPKLVEYAHEVQQRIVRGLHHVQREEHTHRPSHGLRM